MSIPSGAIKPSSVIPTLKNTLVMRYLRKSHSLNSCSKANYQVTGCPLGDTKIGKFLWCSARRVFTSLVSWCHPEGTGWLRSQLFGELLQEPATAVLALPDRVGTLEEGALLGVEQARALARRRYLHSREGDRDARVAG